MFASYITAEQAATKGWEASQVLKRKQHNPAQFTALIDRIADRSVALQGAGDRETVKAIYRDSATPAAALAAISALE